MTRALIPQCRYCGKVRIGDQWVRSEVAADVVGQCRGCMKRAEFQRRARKSRSAVRPLADPFEAVRYDAGDEFWKSNDVRADGNGPLGEPVPPLAQPATFPRGK